jgi:predicted DNA-binding transcriptional regulator YafY
VGSRDGTAASRLVDGWRTRLDGLTSREAVAIFATGVPRALAEFGLGTPRSATLPAPLREQAQHIAQRSTWTRLPGSSATTRPRTRPRPPRPWEQRRLRIRYRTAVRDVEPFGLVLKAGVWYLVAGVDGTVRTYRVGHVADVEELEEWFERPADFDLASWWQSSSKEFERSLRRTRVDDPAEPHRCEGPAVCHRRGPRHGSAGAGRSSGRGRVDRGRARPR